MVDKGEATNWCEDRAKRRKVIRKTKVARTALEFWKLNRREAPEAEEIGENLGGGT